MNSAAGEPPTWLIDTCIKHTFGPLFCMPRKIRPFKSCSLEQLETIIAALEDHFDAKMQDDKASVASLRHISDLKLHAKAESLSRPEIIVK